MTELEGLYERANVALDLIDGMGARIFSMRFGDLTWETIAGLEDVSVETAQRVYEDACEELREILEGTEAGVSL